MFNLLTETVAICSPSWIISAVVCSLLLVTVIILTYCFRSVLISLLRNCICYVGNCDILVFFRISVHDRMTLQNHDRTVTDEMAPSGQYERSLQKVQGHRAGFDVDVHAQAALWDALNPVARCDSAQ